MSFPQTCRRVVSLGTIFLLIPLFSQAATFVVSTGEDLAEILAMATAGDSVLVEAGQYVANELVMPLGVVLAALSQTPDQFPVLYTSAGKTILVCENLTADTRVEGIVFKQITPPMEKLPRRGGGVYTLNAAVQFENCSFLDLMAVYGGAVYCDSGAAPVFTRCYFDANLSEGAGGAINVVRGQDLLVDHCLFTRNVASGGGSVLNAALGASVRIINCTIDGNGQPNSADITAWDAQLIEIGNSILTESSGRFSLSDYSSTPQVHCSDVFGNLEGDWIGSLVDQADQDGNISLWPMYCGADSPNSPYDLDHESPCTALANPSCGSMGTMGIGCENSTGIDDYTDDGVSQNLLPLVTKLQANYPNPFNPQTTIAFDLSHEGQASVDVYDLAGRQVRNLHSGVLPAGNHQLMWNGRGADGRMSAAGVYFFRLKTESAMDTRRMTLVK